MGGVEFKPRQGRHKLCARAVAIMSPLPGLYNNLRTFLPHGWLAVGHIISPVR